MLKLSKTPTSTEPRIVPTSQTKHCDKTEAEGDPLLTSAPEDARIAAFLDAIIARLAPLPADLQGDVRRELCGHLDCLIAAHEELGATRDEAVLAAMRQFGDSRQIARHFRQAWQATTGRESLEAALRDALVTFGAAMGVMIVYMLALSHFVLYPHHPSLVDYIFSGLCWYVIAGLPILGGVKIGWNASRRAVFGAFLALAVLALVSLPFVWLESAGRFDALPYLLRLAISTPAHFFALWLPIGSVAALLTRGARQHRDRRRPRRATHE